MENMKGWHCKNNYNLRKELWLLTIFAQRSIVDVWQGSEFSFAFWVFQGSKYTSVLNMPGFYIYFWFWICQSFEYTRAPNMMGLNRVLSITEYFLGMPFILFNWLGSKVISKNVILPLWKAPWTIAKSWKLLCDYKKIFACRRFF